MPESDPWDEVKTTARAAFTEAVRDIVDVASAEFEMRAVHIIDNLGAYWAESDDKTRKRLLKYTESEARLVGARLALRSEKDVGLAVWKTVSALATTMAGIIRAWNPAVGAAFEALAGLTRNASGNGDTSEG